MGIIVEWEKGTGSQSFTLGKQVVEAPNHLVDEARVTGSDDSLRKWLAGTFGWLVINWSVFNDNTGQHLRI